MSDYPFAEYASNVGRRLRISQQTSGLFKRNGPVFILRYGIEAPPSTMGMDLSMNMAAEWDNGWLKVSLSVLRVRHHAMKLTKNFLVKLNDIGQIPVDGRPKSYSLVGQRRENGNIHLPSVS